MDRNRLYTAWWKYYAAMDRDQALKLITQRAGYLEGRMRSLARFPRRMFKGFWKARLVTAFGMSLGVHKQLLWGLTSAPSGGRMKGGGGARS